MNAARLARTISALLGEFVRHHGTDSVGGHWDEDNYVGLRDDPAPPYPEWVDKQTVAAATLDGAARIVVERDRQIEAEGYDEAHDDAHPLGELVGAAAAYLYVAAAVARDPAHNRDPIAIANYAGDLWPFDDGFVPDVADARPNLVKAGALIAAEIDRLDRAAAAAKEATV